MSRFPLYDECIAAAPSVINPDTICSHINSIDTAAKDKFDAAAHYKQIAALIFYFHYLETGKVPTDKMLPYGMKHRHHGRGLVVCPKRLPIKLVEILGGYLELHS